MVSEFDKKLLKKLSKDSRQSLKNLARGLSVSITTVKNHIDKLREDGVIERFTLKYDEKKLGYGVKALIAVSFKRGKLVEAQKKIGRHRNVMAVYDIAGRYDSMIVCRFETTEKLDQFIKEVLPTDDAQRTETFVVLNTFKEDFNSV